MRKYAKNYTNKLWCFSPPVMLATFTIEIILAVYTVWRYKLDSVRRLVMLLLVFLAIFQLAEYMVCGGLGMQAMEWSRIGYVAITLLPALGFHLASTIAGKSNITLLAAVYGSSLAFVGYFLLGASAFTGHMCTGNYVIFQMSPAVTPLYGLYYYGWVIAGMLLSFAWARRLPHSKQKTAKALRFFAVGYAAFLLPTTTVNIIDPSTVSGIPSIMCGFAVLFAVLLVWKILPLVTRVRTQ